MALFLVPLLVLLQLVLLSLLALLLLLLLEIAHLCREQWPSCCYHLGLGVLLALLAMRKKLERQR